MTIGVGVIGMGFMGRTHVTAYLDAIADGADARLVAVADGHPERRAGRGDASGNMDVAGEGALFDPADVAGHERAEDLLARDDVDVVSICTPTDSHVALATAALDAGKHVLLEKPVALTTGDVDRIAEAASRSPELLCVPAMCMRFWPGWDTLRDAIADERHGALRSLAFRRRGSRPTWNAFYADASRSGGAVFDLHVHDADLVVWCLGEPAAVFSTGDRDHVTTSYRFADGPPHVTAEGGWDHAPGTPFEMTFTAVFERATWLYDGAGPCLRVAADGELRDESLSETSGYLGQVKALLEAVGDPAAAARLPDLGDARRVTQCLESEVRSLASGRAETL